MNTEAIVRQAIGLLDGAPDDSGVFVKFAMLPAGKLLEESWHAHDYELYVGFRMSSFCATVNRIIGVGILSLGAIPPDTETIISVEAETLSALYEKIHIVLRWLPASCADHHIHFHVDQFASYTAPNIVSAPTWAKLVQRLTQGRRVDSPALWDFAIATTTEAAKYRSFGDRDTQFSLRFNLPEYVGSTIYVTVKPVANRFVVEIEDWMSWPQRPWTKSSARAATLVKVGELIAGHLCCKHPEVTGLRVYYGYGCQMREVVSPDALAVNA